jgi:hypothetical protein
MEHQGAGAEARGAFELVDHPGNRLRQKFGVRRREVDQIGGVNQDRRIAELGAKAMEVRADVVLERFRLPLARVLREERDRARVDAAGALEDRADASLGREVGAEQIAG